MLSLELCRQRQQRLLARMVAEELDFVLLSSARLIYYLCGPLVDSSWPQCFALAADGHRLLVTNVLPGQCATTDIRVYTGYTTERFFDRTTMQEELGEALRHFLGGGKRRVGLEAESAPIAVMPLLSEPWTNVTPWLAELRRRKDADEIDCIRATIALTEAGTTPCESGASRE
jgi:Xaa-Pro aminopeptidase